MARPIDTIIMAMSPVPRLRSGFHSAALFSQPNAPDRIRPRIAARTNGRPRPAFSVQVASAPNVRISPWAKFVSPVVP
jgi:hypothetical protein